MLRKTCLLILTCSLLAIVNRTLGAEERNTEGFYIGPVAAMIWINGDYNGLTSLSGMGEIWLIPKVTPGLGYGGVIGFTAKMESDSPLSAGMEAGLLIAGLDGTYGGASYPVWYHNFNVTWRILFEFIPALSVYGQFNLGFAWITIENAAYNGTTTGNVNLTGFTGSFGAGLSWSPCSFLAIRVGASQYLSAIEQGSGITASGSTDPIDDSPTMVETGILWKF